MSFPTGYYALSTLHFPDSKEHTLFPENLSSYEKFEILISSI